VGLPAGLAVGFIVNPWLVVKSFKACFFPEPYVEKMIMAEKEKIREKEPARYHPFSRAVGNLFEQVENSPDWKSD
jgi:hypothetical protein